MAENKNEIQLAFAGGVYFAPLTAVAPKGVDEAFDVEAWLAGYTDEEGVTITPSADNNEIAAWPRGEIVKTSNTNGKVEITVRLYQTKSIKNAGLYFGKAKNTDGGYVLDAAFFGDGFQVYVKAIDINNKTQELWVAPNAELTNRGEIVINHTTVEAFDLTITCRYDETLQGQIVKYDGPWVPGTPVPPVG